MLLWDFNNDFLSLKDHITIDKPPLPSSATDLALNDINWSDLAVNDIN